MLLVVRQTIIDERLEVSRITLLAVLAEVREVQNVLAFLRGPNAFVETVEAAMKMVPVIISWKLILDTVQSESTVGDAIRVTSNQRTKVKWIAGVIIQRIETEDDVSECAIAIRRPQ